MYKVVVTWKVQKQYKSTLGFRARPFIINATSGTLLGSVPGKGEGITVVSKADASCCFAILGYKNLWVIDKYRVHL